ncbi:hypothetical protein SEA_EDEN_67 [Microbacterium phage Eden]|uniref:Uncharacterized protein n=1 Tax=Microbacterium phage Eden TaxID=2250289 RepID=A0A345KWG0_9CAUD|nr:hypothetical protein HOT71_gp67 [Microbacterium phage Eden]AXH47362.1 hypothetical protein SEA_EDEN_67 [Microbacterium phage Eden]
MPKIAFAADVILYPGEAKPGAPERVPSPTAAYLVRNPYSGKQLWLRSQDVLNVVNGVAAVLMEVNHSGRLPDRAVRGRREFINPLTGNTFQTSSKFIIKENA